ncbi:hypothetical protein [Bradyrhizobium sp. CCBAU 51627]|uniref:hypothetical protein n=1 Tax=Bradyrhizobium sp. CCBAU 51627 TaxID=1325088 RepID=UPI002304F166|nr:hypothetical protein [Bradyrhizobium sp. CCBAU 51627]MDA9432405.1 hypothetical protein [Bradyrhizobium sp. CCBAU 51627]
MSDRSVNSRVGRAALAAFTSFALVVASLSPSSAASPMPAKATPAVAGQGTSNATDFSAARRHHYRYYRRGPNAAGLAFMGLAAGLIGGAIAESRRQEYYDNYYYGGPRYYGPGYGYYGGPGYYYNPY